MIPSKILSGLFVVLVGARSDLAVEDLVTLNRGVVVKELKFTNSVPTCVELVISVACIAFSELNIFSIIVVGFSVVKLTLPTWSLSLVSLVASVCLDFFGDNFNMADENSVVGAVLLGDVFEEDVVVDLELIEFIILSIIDVDFSVVPSLTSGKATETVLVVEETRSPLTRFADDNALTGTSIDITSSSSLWFAVA